MKLLIKSDVFFKCGRDVIMCVVLQVGYILFSCAGFPC